MNATAIATNNTDEYGWFLDIETPTEIVITEYRIIPSSRVYHVRNRVVSLLPSPPIVEMAATRIEMQHPKGDVQAVAKQVNDHTIIPVDNAILYDVSEPESIDQFNWQRQRDCVRFSMAVLLIVSIVSVILTFV
jgi:hypothetical protein